MTEQIILDNNTYYTVRSGHADLYARMVGDNSGRLFHFKRVRNGESFGGKFRITKHSGIWECLAKYRGTAEIVVTDSAKDGLLDEFTIFISDLDDKLAGESEKISEKGGWHKTITDKAVQRLSGVGSQPADSAFNEYDGEKEIHKACHVLCAYLGTTPRIPAEDAEKDSPNILEDILLLSNLRYRKVRLDGSWQKSNGGPLIGNFNDGSYAVITPNKTFGHSVYNVRTGKKSKVTPKIAKEIKPEALAVYRTFPSQKLNFAGVIRFIFGEHMISEVTVVLLISLLTTVIRILPPILSKQIFDVLIPGNLIGILVQTVLILTVFSIAELLFTIIMNLALSRVDMKLDIVFQSAIWDRLINMPQSFYNKHTTGELLNRIKGANLIKRLVSVDFIKPVLFFAFSFVNVLVLFNLSANLAKYALLLILFSIAVSMLINFWKARLSYKYIDLENKSVDFNYESINGIERIKASCAEHNIYNVWSKYESKLKYYKNRIKTLETLLSAFNSSYSLISTAVLYFFIQNEPGFGMGSFIAFIATYSIFQKSVNGLLSTIGGVPEMISLYKNLKIILETIPENDVLKTIPKNMTGKLELNNVSFRYGEFEKDILKGISFVVEPGETLGILAVSGSGKSTLLNLLLGFYKPTNGKIYYGGYDSEIIDLRYLRRGFGAVLQHGSLFVGDILGNIVENDTQIDIERVWAAVRDVGLEDFINSLPDKLYTRLEDNFSLFSEGQKQQLLIARAIVKKRLFYFFDESTSSLDNSLRLQVYKRLKELEGTKIIVSQHLSIFELCDKVLLLENGTVTAKGTPEDMLDLFKKDNSDTP